MDIKQMEISAYQWISSYCSFWYFWSFKGKAIICMDMVSVKNAMKWKQELWMIYMSLYHEYIGWEKVSFTCHFCWPSTFPLPYITFSNLTLCFQHWTDIYLSWNPDSYPGVQNLRFPSNLVWVPDILLYNRYVTFSSFWVGLIRLVIGSLHCFPVTFVHLFYWLEPCSSSRSNDKLIYKSSNTIRRTCLSQIAFKYFNRKQKKIFFNKQTNKQKTILTFDNLKLNTIWYILFHYQSWRTEKRKLCFCSLQKPKLKSHLLAKMSIWRVKHTILKWQQINNHD